MKRDHQTVRVAVRAVDVGYFNTKFTLGRKERGDSSMIETRMVPSLAPMLTRETLSTARKSQQMDGCAVDVDGALYYVGSDATHNMSAMEPRSVTEDYCMTAEYLALVRGALHSMALDAGVEASDEFVIGHLVLGLPLTTLNKYRVPLAERVQGEHIVGAGDPAQAGSSPTRRITVENVHVVPQPRGALLDHAVANGGKMEGWTLVVDPGGGTLDWFLASKKNANYQRSGAYPKGMLACAYAVADEINPAWRHNLIVIERIDKAIRDGAAAFRAEGVDYPLADFMPRVHAVVGQSVSMMMAKLGSIADVDQIVLTGGGAKVYRAFFAAYRPNLEPMLQIGADPVFANVRGFQIYGEIQQTRSAAK